MADRIPGVSGSSVCYHGAMDIARPALEEWFNQPREDLPHDLGGTMVPADAERMGHFLTDWDVRYAPTTGSADCRGLIASSDRLEPDDLVLTCGATEAGVAALLAAVRPGSAAVLQDPLYYLFEPWLATLGVAIRRWRAAPDGTWQNADIEGLLDPSVSVVVVNSPHNPTGRTLAIAELAEVVFDRSQAVLIVDEVYRGVTDDGPGCAARMGPRVLAVSSASKRWGLPGLRLGWVACTDPDLGRRVLAWHEHLSNSAPRPSETALVALWPELERETEVSRAIAARNAAIVARWLAHNQDRFSGSLPDAGVTMLLAPRGGLDDVQFAIAVRRSGVFVIPGSTLGYPGQIRIGFGHRDPGRLEAALEALAVPVAIPA